MSKQENEPRILVLRMKGKWWDLIASGEKTTELRLQTDHWRQRLIGREYDEIHLWRGYPPKTDTDKLLRRKWSTVTERTIVHEEFGKRPVKVFAIDVSRQIADYECVIGKLPPCDGRNWECQCARCGSSADGHECEECGGDGHIEEYDDECMENEIYDCGCCYGESVWYECMSSRSYCEANPMEGRERIKPGVIEWFTFDPVEKQTR